MRADFPAGTHDESADRASTEGALAEGHAFLSAIRGDRADPSLIQGEVQKAWLIFIITETIANTVYSQYIVRVGWV